MKKVLLQIFVFFAVGLVLFFVVSALEEKSEPEISEGIEVPFEETPSFSSEPDYANFTNIVFDNSSVSVTGTGVMVTGTAVTIAFPGTYRLSGVSDNASVTINCEYDGNVFLWLDGLSLTCETGPAIYVNDAVETTIILQDATENYLADAEYSLTDDDASKCAAAVFSHDDLNFTGAGTLTIAGFNKNGLQCNDSLCLTAVNIIITAINDAVNVNDAVYVTESSIQLLSSGDGIQCDDGDIVIAGSSIIIATEEDGVSAEGNVSLTDTYLSVGTRGGSAHYSDIEALGCGAKGLKGENISICNCQLDFDCADDALHAMDTCVLSQGNYVLRSGNNAIYAGTSICVEDVSLDIPDSYDGIQASQITLQSGEFSIVADDDALQATMGDLLSGVSAVNCFIEIMDGKLSLTSACGMTSDGDILLLGGDVYIQTYTIEEAAFQWGNSLVLDDCCIFGTGLFSESDPAEENLSQCVLNWTFAENKPETTVVAITDVSGNILYSATPEQTYSMFFYSAPNLETEGVYTISAGEEICNIQLGGLFTTGSNVPVETAQTSSSTSKKDGGMPGMR